MGLPHSVRLYYITTLQCNAGWLSFMVLLSFLVKRDKESLYQASHLVHPMMRFNLML